METNEIFSGHVGFYLRGARGRYTSSKRVLIISDSTYRETILQRSNRNDIDTNVEPGGRAVPITSAPFPFRLSVGKEKKKGSGKKKRTQIDPAIVA